MQYTQIYDDRTRQFQQYVHQQAQYRQCLNIVYWIMHF